MVLYSWQEYWHIPHEKERSNLAGLAMNIFLLTSLADAVQGWNPDNPINDPDVSSEEALEKIRSGDVTPLGTRMTVDEIEKIITSKKYPNTVEKMFDVRDPTAVEICLQLIAMLPPRWKIYSTGNIEVPYILSNDVGDYISPVEVYDPDTEDVQILFAVPQKEVTDASALIDEIYSHLKHLDANTQEELKLLYPLSSDYIDRAFKPGAPVASVISEAVSTGEFASLGDEVPLITSILRIKSISGASRLLSH